MTTATATVELTSVNDWADWWRNEIGVNVIPAISKEKMPIVKWKQFQGGPIPDEIHRQWKEQGLFDNGMAIILGRVWHRIDRQDYFLACIDVDNKKGIEELFTRNGKQLTIEEFASKTIVEQHRDNPNRLHLYVYTVGKQLRNKSSDIGHLAVDVNPDLIPCFEVKATSGLLSFPCPCIHKDGHPIEILGTREPAVLRHVTIDDMQNHLDSICSRFNLGVGRSDRYERIPINELFREDSVIYEGHNRHESLLRVMESLLRRNAGILSANQIEQLSRDWNVKHCSPPLEEKEFNKQWKCATDFISKNGHDASASDTKTTSLADEDMQDYEDMLIAEYHLKTVSDTMEIYYYDGERGIYEANAESILMMRIESDFGFQEIGDNGKPISRLTNNKFNEHLGHIRRRTQTSRSAFNPSIEWLATKDCMVNLKTGETADFSPDFMVTNSIPVVYDKGYPTGQIADFFRLVESDSGKIMKFLQDIMGVEDLDRFLDFLAYCLWREYKYGHWLLLHGAGFNGKSILLQLIERFIGSENVTGETLDRLLHERFSVAQLYQKMVNIDAYVSEDTILDNTGVIKKLTGNDIHTGEFKFKKPFPFRNHAKLIFSCNKLPHNDDNTTAFHRRPIIISFTKIFLGEKEDPHLIEKLCTDPEFTDLLSLLLPRLQRVIREGIVKITDDYLAKNYDKYIKGSNPIRYFFEKALEADPNGRVTKPGMYKHYQEFCKMEGTTCESQTFLSRQLTDDYHLKSESTRVKGVQIRYWKGVNLVDWQKKEKDEQSMMGDYQSFEEAVRYEE
jgi:P4 family phage/plasmid primase-like protien